MKSVFSLPFACVFFLGCGYNTDETAQFVRLEKDLAGMAHTYDAVEYRNPYAQFEPWDTLMAEYTDSLLLISDTYDSLITQKALTDYSAELKTVQAQINRRRQNRNDNRWKKSKIDSILVCNPLLDSDFRKYNFRAKLSRIFDILYSVSYCGNGVYEMFEPHTFVTYGRRGDTLETELALGYIFTDDNLIQLSLTRNGQAVRPVDSSMSYSQTKALFIPKDTGTYILQGTLDLYDPITGKVHTKREQRNIYVKP